MEGMVTEPRPIFAFPREEWLRTCRAHIVALMRLLLVDDVLKYILHQLKNQQKQEQMLEELLERAVGE
jgi:hypothetical protein